MAELREEYTDIKNIRHKVEHVVIKTDDGDRKEDISQELTSILLRAVKRNSRTAHRISA